MPIALELVQVFRDYEFLESNCCKLPSEWWFQFAHPFPSLWSARYKPLTFLPI